MKKNKLLQFIGFNSENKKENAQIESEFDSNSHILHFYLGVRKFFSQGRWRWVLIGLVILLAGLGTWKFFKQRAQQNIANPSPVKTTVNVDIENIKEPVFFNDTGRMEIEEETQSGEASGTAKSENYLVRSVLLGEESAVIERADEDIALEISNVRSEILTSKDGAKMKFLITWNTNKLAKSSVGYAKNNAENAKVFNESSFGFSHALVVPNLEADSRYTYEISAQDQWGNKMKSEKFSAYTGKKAVSVFELIAAQMSSIFGWAIRR